MCELENKTLKQSLKSEVYFFLGVGWSKITRL